jgi:hypothetical protein
VHQDSRAKAPKANWFRLPDVKQLDVFRHATDCLDTKYHWPLLNFGLPAEWSRQHLMLGFNK